MFLSVIVSLALFPSPTSATTNQTINFQSKVVNKTTGLNVTVGSPACVKSGADTCDFQIRIWNHVTNNDTTSGSGNLMFTQTFQDVEIGDSNGIFNLTINSCGSAQSGNSEWGTTTGTCTSVDDSDADSDPGVNFDRDDLWVELGFASTDTSGSLGTFSELFTRQVFRSVAMVYQAQNTSSLNGLTDTGFVKLAPPSSQSTNSTNSLINLITTANTSNALVMLNENGAGTPDLLALQQAGITKFQVINSGSLFINQATQTIDVGQKITILGNASTNLNAYFSATSGDSSVLNYFGVTATEAFSGTFTNTAYSLRTNATNRFTLTTSGTATLGTATNTAYFNIAPATTTLAQVRLVSSAGTNVSSPNAGDLWYNGTNLYFRSASLNNDLLGNLLFAPNTTQTTASANRLINISTTANSSNTLIRANENGAGTTASLIDLQVGGISRLKLSNSGDLSLAMNYNWTMQANSNPGPNNSLRLVTTHSAGANPYTYWRITNTAYGYTLVSGDILEYDVFCDTANPACRGAVELDFTDATALRSSTPLDQNGINANGGSIVAYASGRWYHRRVVLPAGVIGKIIDYFSLVEESDTAGSYTNYYRRIFITNGSSIKTVAWESGVPTADVVAYSNFSSNQIISGSYFKDIELSGDLLPTNNNVASFVYQFARAIGNTATDESAFGITTDPAGNFIVTGQFSGTIDFDPTAGTDNKVSNGAVDAYVMKINRDGTYAWTRTVGHSGTDGSWGVATDSAGNVYNCGNFGSTTDLDGTAGVDNRVSAGNFDAYVTKYEANGDYGFSRTFGSTGADICYDVAVDAATNLYLSGSFSATVDFDFGAGVVNQVSAGGSDAFVVKHNAAGTLAWAKRYGGTLDDNGYGLDVTPAGDVYTSGPFQGTNIDFDSTAGTDTRSSAGGNDTYLVKHLTDGSYGWVQTWGSTGDDQSFEAAADPVAGGVVAVGLFNGTVDFDGTSGTANRTSAGSSDGYISKYNFDGTYAWTRIIAGSTSTDEAISVDIDNSSSVFVGGYFQGTVDMGDNVADDSRTSAGGRDAYINKYYRDGNFAWSATWGGSSGTDDSGTVAVDNFGNVFGAGAFTGTVDANPGPGVDNIVSTSGTTDVQMVKLYDMTPEPASNIGSSTQSFANAYIGQYQGKTIFIYNFDLAEEYEVEDETIEAGDVVRFKQNSTNSLVVERTANAGDAEAIGVISTEPGLYLKDWNANRVNGRPLALAGRVPVKVTLENGEIKKGDLLTPSSTAGYAMKATDQAIVIGRAMEGFSAAASAGDSTLVQMDLSETQQQAEAIIQDMQAAGDIPVTDVPQAEALVTDFTQTLPAEVGKGRIMMYVELGYVGSGVLMPKAVTIEGDIDSQADQTVNTTTMESVAQLTNVSLDKIVSISNIISAPKFSSLDSSDLILQLSSASSALRVLDAGGNSLFSVDSNGKLSIRNVAGAALGRATITTGMTEVFVPTSGVTPNSQIHLTPNQLAKSRVRSIEPGIGFTIEITAITESDVIFNYLIIN